jgi:DNA-binding NarL/FixJ family response regulator
VHPAWAQEWLVHTVRQAVHRQQVEAVNHTLQAALQRAHEALETARVQSEAMQQKLQKSQQAVVGCVHHLDQARQKGAAYSRTRPHTRLQPLPLRLQEVGESGTSGRQVDRVLTELEVSPEPGLICGAAGVPLSASEARVALMIKAGMKNADIAAQLYISPETVKTHRKNIRKKLGLQGSGTNLHAYLQTLDTDPDIVTTTA